MQQPEYRVSGYRWVNLVVYTVITFMAGMGFLAMAPVLDMMAERWSISFGAASLLMSVIGLFQLLLSIPTGWLSAKVGFKLPIAIGASLLALGFLLFLVLNLAMAFAFTYPYTVPAFRGMGLPNLLVAALVATLPALGAFAPSRAQAERRPLWGWLVAALLVVSSTVFSWPRPVAWQEGGPVRAGTYNVHYGFNTPWQLNLEAIARTIEESGADVMMLREVDTCRITSYGIDDALWLARRLGMAEVYQPTLEGLSGIALLTRYPVVASGGALLDSELEQTGIVHARVRVGGRDVDAYGIWLGLAPEERARQLTDALVFIGAASPALLGGDFNATPDSPVYARLAEANFVDPFAALGLGDAPTSPAVEPRERIDFVWGRGLEPVDGAVLDSLASDHRMVITEWRLP